MDSDLVEAVDAFEKFSDHEHDGAVTFNPTPVRTNSGTLWIR